MAIKWEEPAVHGNAKRDWRGIFEELRANPLRWALVAEGVSPGASGAINKGRYGDAKPGEFEAVTRRIKNGKGDVYARYVGGES